MIDRRTFIAMGNPIIVGPKAYLECGCSVVVGLRTDTKEAATAATSCSPEHRDLMARFNLALGDSLVNPTERPLLDVVDEILEAL